MRDYTTSLSSPTYTIVPWPLALLRCLPSKIISISSSEVDEIKMKAVIVMVFI